MAQRIKTKEALSQTITDIEHRENAKRLKMECDHAKVVSKLKRTSKSQMH
jgi:hypothetical protein